MFIKNKGNLEPGLKTLIEISIAILLIIAFVFSLSTVMGGSLSTSGSASSLGRAIKSVALCIEERGSECDLEVEVDVIMKQDPGERGAFGILESDPEWVIFHDTELDSYELNRDQIPDKTQAAPPIVEECSDFWDPEDIIPDRCKDGICYGLIEAKGLFKKVEVLDEETVRKIRPFWIVSPCYAGVVVRPVNPEEGCSNCIEICYTGTQVNPFPPGEWDGDYNFCHNDDSGEWPAGSDAWDDLGCAA